MVLASIMSDCHGFQVFCPRIYNCMKIAEETDVLEEIIIDVLQLSAL